MLLRSHRRGRYLWILALLCMSLGCRSVVSEPTAEPVYDASNDPLGFHRVLARDRAAGLVLPDQVVELERQQRSFEGKRAELESQHPGRVIGIAGGQVFVADTPREIVAAVDRSHPEAMIYMESADPWIYHTGEVQSPLSEHDDSPFGGERVAPAMAELVRQRDALEAALISQGDPPPPWAAHVNGKLYVGAHRMQLVEQVRADSVDALVYCSCADGRWDAISTQVSWGDTFLDFRHFIAMIAEAGAVGGAADARRQIKADVGSATIISTFDGADLAGLGLRYRGVLVAGFGRLGETWSAGFIDDLQLRMGIGDGEVKVWQPPMVLIVRRTIVGLDFMKDLSIYPRPQRQDADAPSHGLSPFMWSEWADPDESQK